MIPQDTLSIDWTNRHQKIATAIHPSFFLLWRAFPPAREFCKCQTFVGHLWPVKCFLLQGASTRTNILFFRSERLDQSLYISISNAFKCFQMLRTFYIKLECKVWDFKGQFKMSIFLCALDPDRPLLPLPLLNSWPFSLSDDSNNALSSWIQIQHNFPI